MAPVFKMSRIRSTVALRALVWVWAALNEGALLPSLGVIKVMEIVVSVI